MSAFERQLEAIGTALLMVKALPDTAVWALEVTNDDDASSPTVLNIFAPTHEWEHLASALKLGRAIDESTDERDIQFRSYRRGTLHVSLIEEE